MLSSRSKYIKQFADKPVAVAAVLSTCYFAGVALSTAVAPGALPLQALAAFAVTAVIFGSMWLSVLVALLAYVCALVVHFDPVASVVLGASSGLGVAAEAYLLRALKLDPLFRRKRDVFVMIAGAFALSVVTALMRSQLADAPLALTFVHALAAQLIGTAFLVRWIAKPVFRRTALEWIEIAVSHTLLVAVYVSYFLEGVRDIAGISLVIYSLPLLFWIALRLRPRFVTFSFVLVAALAVLGQLQTGGGLMVSFNIAILLSVLSAAFLLISAQEEERRVQKNRTQVEFAMLQNAITRMEAESKAKNDFIAVLSHELRNPLAPLVSSIELLQLAGERTQDERETLSLMADRVSTVRRLLDDLLDVSRISEGKIQIQRERFDLREAIASAIITTQHYRVELHQSIEYDPPRGPVFVFGDEVRLEQVFSNILANASKYSHSGDTIRMELRHDGEVAFVYISDNGVGIPAPMLSNIFKPFQQVEQGERTRKGLGIGLWLVRNIVELHGGTVTVQSEGEGKGSIFLVRLPAMR